MTKKKSYSVLSIGLSTIGSALVGLLLSSLMVFSIGAYAGDSGWRWVVQAITVILFMAMLYSPAWMCADHDVNAVQFKKMEYDPLKGMKIGLVAAVPFWLTSLIPIICKSQLFFASDTLDTVPVILMAVYRLCNVHIITIINAILPPNLPAAELSWLGIVLAGALNLLIPLTTYISYSLGYRHISLMEKLVFKKASNQKRRR